MKWEVLFKELDAGFPVLTASRRLAHHLRIAYGQHHGRPFSGELISTLEDAISEQYGRLEDPYLLLTDIQEMALWSSVIQESQLLQEGVSPLELAKLAKASLELSLNWELAIGARGYLETAEQEAYQVWQHQVLRRCQQQRWRLPAQRLPQLIQRLGELNWPKRLYWAGFCELTPLQKTFANALAKLGCEARPINLSLGLSEKLVRFFKAPDAESDYEAAVAWAHQETVAGKSVAIVVPNLDQARPRLIQCLNRYFGPSAYRMAGGTPLIQYPLSRVAVDLVRLKTSSDFESMSRLLRAPYWLGDGSAGHEIEAYLRRQKPLPQTLEDLILVVSQQFPASDSLPILKSIAELQWPTRALPSVWAQYFAQVLKLAGFPGHLMLSEEEQAAVGLLRQALQDLASLDLQFDALPPTQALFWWEWSLHHRVCQLKDPKGLRPEILGGIEAQGLIFDAIWILGLHEGAWMSKVQLNPFLPWQIQRQAGLPKSSVARERQYASQVFQGLCAQAKQLFLSYPGEEAGLGLEPAAFLGSFGPPVSLDRLPLEAYPVIPRSNISFQAPAVSPGEIQNLSQLARVFQRQALCPFQAFAKIRLGLSELPKIETVVPPTWQGSILHQCLELIWRELGSQSVLKARSEGPEFGNWIKDQIWQVLKRWQNKWKSIFSEGWLEVERDRLSHLIQSYLALEMKRAPFEVESQELSLLQVLGGLPIQVRIDRIDRLSDGTKIVLDYKTGSVSLREWFERPPLDPQLPMYAVATQAQGAAFAILQAGRVRFEGVTADADQLPDVSSVAEAKAVSVTTFSELLARWQVDLETMAQAFVRGEAEVRPVSVARACRYCDLKPVCRIQEKQSLVLEDDLNGDSATTHDR